MRTQPLAPLFISHGSPMTSLEPGLAGAFQARLGLAVEAAFGRPRAVLAISAHSLSREPVLLAAPQHHTVHDFSGFPPALYDLRYDAPGEPALAVEVATALQQAGMPVHLLPQGGLDHGIWTPLRFAWPAADLPVLPLAFPPDWSPARLFALGEALAPLAAQGVLVMGSGSITHNLGLLFGRGGLPAVAAPELADSAAFRRWMAERSQARDWDALLAYRRLAPGAVAMHPTDEHLLPWFVAAGAGGRQAAPLRLHASLTYGALGMDSYAFGPAAPALAAALADAGAGVPA